MYFQLSNFSVIPLYALNRNALESNACRLRVPERNYSRTLATSQPTILTLLDYSNESVFSYVHGVDIYCHEVC